MTQTKVGWRPYVATTTTTASTLLTSIYGVWNADKLGTSLDSSIYGVYNGDNVNDTSGNARNGTNVNNVTFTTGKVGNAFTFNGSNYISLPNNTFKFTGDFSVSLWFYCKVSANPQTLINGYDYTGSLSGGWVLASFSTGYMEFQVYVNTQATSKSRYQVPFNTSTYNNQWVHITLTRASGTSTKIYINGTEASGSFSKGSVADNPTYLTNCYSEIGGDFVTSGGLINPCDNGTKIDAVTVWNKVLTADKVASLYNTGTGAEYPFSSQTLPSPNDSVSANHGTLMNGTTFTTGKIGKAFTFDGINDYIALPDNSLNLTNKFSYSFWLKSSDTTGFTVIIGNIQGARAPYGFAHGYQYWLEYGKIVTGYRDGNDSTNYRIESTSVANGSWNHIVITTDITNRSTGIKIYINGNLNASGATPANLVYSSPMKSCIGARNQAGVAEYFLSNGTMLDAVSVWNKELSATEITELYNSGNGKQYPY
jgi:hypothetical protein